MMLYKFCKKEFNIALGCNTLRLGTLQEYCEMDPSFYIADQWEGISQAETKGNTVTFTGEELKASGTSFPAIDIDPESTGKVTINLKDRMIMKSPNVYIFSVSLSETNSLLTEYDSKYSISDPQLFSSELLRLFVNQLTINDFEENNILFSEIAQMSIQCIHRPVIYKEKPFHITNENKIEILKTVNDIVATYFTKSVEKVKDQEYRFVIIPMIGQRIISVKKEAKFLNIKAFNGIIHNV